MGTADASEELQKSKDMSASEEEEGPAMRSVLLAWAGMGTSLISLTLILTLESKIAVINFVIATLALQLNFLAWIEREKAIGFGE